MSEHIYITGGRTDTDTRIKGSVDVKLVDVEGIFFALLVPLLLLSFIFVPKGRTERITVDGVDCVVISRSGISCDWQNAKPATPKKEGEK